MWIKKCNKNRRNIKSIRIWERKANGAKSKEEEECIEIASQEKIIKK